MSIGETSSYFSVSNAYRRPLKLGFVPMADCAPLVVAQELGLFAQQGLSVELCREPGWATIREKIYHRELDAAQAPGSMVFELSWGYGGLVCPCITACVTALNGNAITLSNELWDMGVRMASASLKRVIQRESFAPIHFCRGPQVFIAKLFDAALADVFWDRPRARCGHRHRCAAAGARLFEARLFGRLLCCGAVEFRGIASRNRLVRDFDFRFSLRSIWRRFLW